MYGNEVIFMLHATVLAGVITLVDLFGAAKILNSRYYAPFESFISAGLFYLVITFTIVFIFKLIEGHFLKHLKR
jgi:arginine/ornithine transport system permease protein